MRRRVLLAVSFLMFGMLIHACVIIACSAWIPVANVWPLISCLSRSPIAIRTRTR